MNYVFGVGLLQFIYIFTGEICDPLFVKAKRFLHIDDKKFYWHIWQSLRCTVLMMFAWIFFRSASFTDALKMIRSVFVMPNIEQVKDVFHVINGLYLRTTIFILLSLLAIIAVDLLHENKKSIRIMIGCSRFPVRLAFYLLLAFTIIIFGAYGNQYIASDFIYTGF